jgi:hypothetical protein
MAWNGSGVFARLYNWATDKTNGIKIRADRMDGEFDNFKTGLENCVTLDGQNTPSANLPMGNFKHTGVGNASARNQYAAAGQVQDQSFIWGGTGGGTADAITLSPSPAITAYAAGQKFSFIASGDNTGAVTVNVSSVGSKSVTKRGSTALVAGEIVSGSIVSIQYDGTQFQLLNVFTTKFLDTLFRLQDDGDATKQLAFQLSGITTATTRTITVQDEDGTLALTSEFTYSNVAGSDGRMPLPRMWISGLVISNNVSDANNDIDISAGECRDATNAHNLILAASLTKQLDAAWAVGTNAGGLDTGAKANSTWYFVWLIKRSDTGVVDALFSTSSTAPTMPTNYDYKRLIGAVRTDGSSNILAFSALETDGGGIESLWSDPPLDVNDATPGTAANLRTLSVPTGIKVWAWVNAYLTVGAATHGLYLSSPDVIDEAASAGAGVAPLASLAMGATSTSNPTHGPLRIRTNTSSQIRARQTVNSQQSIVTLGWEWSRR